MRFVNRVNRIIRIQDKIETERDGDVGWGRRAKTGDSSKNAG